MDKFQTMSECQEKALTRSAKKALRKAGLPNEFVSRCRIWSCRRDEGIWTNFTLYTGKFSHRDKRRLEGIIPHLIKSLRKTKRACGFKLPIKPDNGGIFSPFNLAEIVGEISI